jgi:ABC-type Fe3+ transport system permease subunit
MSFALILLLGGGPPVETLETAIYSNLRNSWLDVSKAASCAVWELLLTLVPWILVLLFQARSRRKFPQAGGAGADPTSGQGTSGRWGGPVLALAAFWVLPYLVLLAPDSWRALGDPSIRSDLGAPAWLSLRLAFCAALLAVVTAVAGLIASSKFKRAGRVIGLTLAVPSGVSALVLGLGFWTVFGSWVDPFEGNFAAMAVLQATLLVPVVFRALWPLTDGIRQNLLDAAATLGATPLRAFWIVEWPRWRRTVFGITAVAIGAALGELAAVSLFYSEKLVPLPLLIARWMGQYRFADARAVAGLLWLLSAGTVATVTTLGAVKVRSK